MNWEEIKKHKNVLIGIGIVLILAYIFLHVMYAKKVNVQSEASMQNNTVSSTQQVDVDQLVGSIDNNYKQSAAFKECIAADMGIQTCIRESVYEKVRSSGDMQYCADLDSTQEKENCKLSFASTKASETGDMQHCTELGESKRSCEQTALFAKATMTGDMKVCEQIGEEDQGMVDSCKEQVVTEIAMKSLDETKCSVLEGPSQDMCKDQVQFTKEEEKRIAEEQAALAAEQESIAQQQAENTSTPEESTPPTTPDTPVVEENSEENPTV